MINLRVDLSILRMDAIPYVDPGRAGCADKTLYNPVVRTYRNPRHS